MELDRFDLECGIWNEGCWNWTCDLGFAMIDFVIWIFGCVVRDLGQRMNNYAVS